MTWMKDFLDSTKDLESPQAYCYWSILTVISAVAGRRLWVNRGGVYNLYPNIYTFLISKRSGLRKGIPVNIAKKLANDIGRVRVIDGQNSIQGVLKELTKVKTVGNGHIIKNAEGFLITGEFASFMLSDGIGFSLTTLTDLYDSQYHEQGYTKRLASQEELVLKAPCLTGLFASNETHFFDAVPKNAISGGFLARTFCIYEDKRNTLNSLTGQRRPVPGVINYSLVLDHLTKISKLEGEIVPDSGAYKAFDDWYYDFSGKDYEQEDETGTSERIGDNIWKAAMLLGLADNQDKRITEANMDEAIFRTIDTFNGLKKLLVGGASDKNNIKSIVMRNTVAAILETEPLFEVERKKILRKGAGIFGVYDLDECIEHLLQAGMIKIDKRGQEVYYKFTQMMIKKHLELKSKGNSNGIS